ncbi:hypothetical protein QUB70_18710 [Microcoleus sp. A003_D6]
MSLPGAGRRSTPFYTKTTWSRPNAKFATTHRNVRFWRMAIEQLSR